MFEFDPENSLSEEASAFNKSILKFDSDDDKLIPRTLSDVVLLEKVNPWIREHIQALRESFLSMNMNTENMVCYEMSLKQYAAVQFALLHDSKSKSRTKNYVYVLDEKTMDLKKCDADEDGNRIMSSDEMLVQLGMVEAPSLEDVNEDPAAKFKEKEKALELELKEKKQKIINTTAGKNLMSLADALKSHDYLLSEEEKQENDKVSVGNLLKDLGLD